MSEEFTRPRYLEVSNHFFHDARDFYVRYKHCMESDGPLFYTPRSMRTKSFIDLRMGIESVLKSLICYFENADRQGKTLINWIEKYGHDIAKMMRKIRPHLPEAFVTEYEGDIFKMDDLPVGLRYRLDAWDFRDNREDYYCDTIGSDYWLERILEALAKLIDFANENLKPHSRVVGSPELLAEITEPRFEKYT